MERMLSASQHCNTVTPKLELVRWLIAEILLLAIVLMTNFFVCMNGANVVTVLWITQSTSKLDIHFS